MKTQQLAEGIPLSSLVYLRRKIVFWGTDHFALFPWRVTKNHWHALVAEIMLQRTRAEQVVPAFEKFRHLYPHPRDLAIDTDSVVFATLGLHWREELLRDLAAILATIEIPIDRESLMALPGIGSYIAAAYRSMHLGIRDVIIDSNVVRLYGRFFGFETDPETRRKRWFIDLAERITPQRVHRQYNYGLIDFTRKICAPNPNHESCPLRNQCKYYIAMHAPPPSPA